MDKLEVQLEEEKALRLAETTKQNERFGRLESEFKDKINQFIAQSAKQEEEIRLLKSKLNHEPISTSNVHEKNYFSNDNDDTRSSKYSPRTPPSSCRQLSNIGHFLDGIYLVANPDTNKIETVYCDFTGTTRNIIIYIGTLYVYLYFGYIFQFQRLYSGAWTSSLNLSTSLSSVVRILV